MFALTGKNYRHKSLAAAVHGQGRYLAREILHCQSLFAPAVATAMLDR
jgi:hypothetical protein